MQHFQLVTTLKNDLQELVCTCIYEVDLSERCFENFAFFFSSSLVHSLPIKEQEKKTGGGKGVCQKEAENGG